MNELLVLPARPYRSVLLGGLDRCGGVGSLASSSLSRSFYDRDIEVVLVMVLVYYVFIVPDHLPPCEITTGASGLLDSLLVVSLGLVSSGEWGRLVEC